jgi:hypothetical protein
VFRFYTFYFHFRNDADKYIYQVQKRRHMKGRKIISDKTPVNKKHHNHMVTLISCVTIPLRTNF